MSHLQNVVGTKELQYIQYISYIQYVYLEYTSNINYYMLTMYYWEPTGMLQCTVYTYKLKNIFIIQKYM